MAVFLTYSALLCLLLLLAGAALLTVSAKPEARFNSSPAALSTTPLTRIIIDVLLGISDFGNWAAVVNGTDAPFPLPPSATFFIPTDRALSWPNFQSYIDQATFLYHIVPRGLSLFDLRRLKVGDHLRTLLPNKTILVTNNSASNFTVDGCRIIRPDMLGNGSFTLHGIDCVLNYSLYGGRDMPSPTSSDSSLHMSNAPALSHSTEIMFRVYAVLAVFTSKLGSGCQRNVVEFIAS